ncbi:MAG: 3-isopropylmalate dehydratase large subunit [Candidatus Viridilinea halotolerans]|uniref:3-isopropylmalate dehydratase large subunit n=1 Tax=Candidatus Viridilinea halotolerans TaxID=2491704 RepID=A0A426TZ50_9CHLR|nr:MAG: 3-isopropylmalate dehydratase large subunit [Candidatus Viridilinea halotolerans]
MTNPKTLFDKVWDAHVVRPETDDTPAVLYIDLHLIHEVTSPQAFSELRQRGIKVRRPDRTLGTMDHSTPTTPRNELGIIPVIDPQAQKQLQQLRTNCTEFGIILFELGSLNQGIVHVIGPEQGLTQPGMTIVCGDSHTSTHGAFGALAFGIGTSEVGHVLATQCLLQYRPQTCAVRVEGTLQAGVGAKDIILALIAKYGVGGGTGHVFEYMGSAIRALSMEERMTICNMSIEGGARAGMVAPDETTFAYVAGRPYAPQGADFEAALARWRTLPSDEGAQFAKEMSLDASSLAPMITYGTNPAMGIAIDAPVPTLADMPDAASRQALESALAYMGFEAGRPLLGHPVDVVFIGSCTNSRISDLRSAAAILKDRKVAAGIRVMVVPGSQRVKRQAEEEGLDAIFKAAGAEWREAGCSACLGMNDDKVPSGKYAISSSNRNFVGRQGPGARTLLASPLTAAAAAVTGCVTDPRTMMLS